MERVLRFEFLETLELATEASASRGWTKARELVKVARRDGPEFASCTWVHKAKELPREEFKREVERHLTEKETEAWEIIYFKL